MAAPTTLAANLETPPLPEVEAPSAQLKKEKKKLVRRTAPDRSQRTRLFIQWLFALLNLWLGVQFYLWVRYYETFSAAQGASAAVAPNRPAGVDGWLPITGLINLKYALSTGAAPKIHPSAMWLFVAFVLMSLLLKKAFCSWLCPIGTLSEYLWKAGRKLLGRNFELPRLLDLPLRGLKYLLLGFFLFIIGSMGAEELATFMQRPYGIIADVKMLNFFRHMSGSALAIVALLLLGSLAIRNLWCRYLCPYGALMGLAALLSPVTIRRDEPACIDCAKCAKACPQALPVDTLVRIRSAECIACLECVAACPAENALQFALPMRSAQAPAARWRGRVLSPKLLVAALAAIFFLSVGYAKLSGHWQTNVPRAVYMDLVPHAAEFSH